MYNVTWIVNGGQCQRGLRVASAAAAKALAARYRTGMAYEMVDGRWVRL